MRKLTMVATLVVLVPLIAAAAFAADQIIRCQTLPCYGTKNNDKIYERHHNGANDRMIMKGGHDIVLANRFTRDIDVTKGGKGSDKINLNDGDRLDTASGGPGRSDWCIVDSRKEVGRGCGKVTVR